MRWNQTWADWMTAQTGVYTISAYQECKWKHSELAGQTLVPLCWYCGWFCLHTHAHTNTHTIMLTRFAWKINSAIRLRLQRLDSFLKLFGSKMKNCTRHALISYNTCTHTHECLGSHLYMYCLHSFTHCYCVRVCVCLNCGGKERLMYCAHIRQC